MKIQIDDPLGTEFLTAVYEVNGPEKEARAYAERICLDQTIEAEADLLAPPLRAKIVGRVEEIRPLAAGRYQVIIRYAGHLVGNEHSDLLNLVFGTSSLRQDVRLLWFSLTQGLLSSWRGPRQGIAGLRRAVGVCDRPLMCAVLKPLGRSPVELAELGAQFVRGGADLIKDDQALLDQPFCPFSERVARCAEAIGDASMQRGRPCLYFAHVSGALDTMRQRAAEAKRLGATGLLVGPGLTGFDGLRVLAADESVALPIASHPTFLGACASEDGTVFSPAVAYALLPRLAGADLTIYPGFDAGYAMSKEACVSVAVSCRQPWHHLLPTMPAVGGRMDVHRVGNLNAALGQDTVFVLGSRIQQHERGVVAAMEEFQRALSQPL
jgi:ribulose-bisphosphate carboxylase large chain